MELIIIEFYTINFEIKKNNVEEKSRYRDPRKRTKGDDRKKDCKKKSDKKKKRKRNGKLTKKTSKVLILEEVESIRGDIQLPLVHQ